MQYKYSSFHKPKLISQEDIILGCSKEKLRKSWVCRTVKQHPIDPISQSYWGTAYVVNIWRRTAAEGVACKAFFVWVGVGNDTVTAQCAEDWTGSQETVPLC